MAVEFSTESLVGFRIPRICHDPVAEPGGKEIHWVAVISLHERRISDGPVPLHVREYMIGKFPTPCHEPEQGIPVQVSESYVELAQVIESGNEFPADGLAYGGSIYHQG